MEHAWLDSLSEDWVSQPASDTSIAQLPPLKVTDSDPNYKAPTPPSRIPRRAVGARPHLSATHDSSFNVLSERSMNDINKSSQRLSTKLAQHTKSPHAAKTSRSVSVATVGSVIHNTIQYKSSPGKGDGETPEWKRRLVYGNLQYGEQRDLFCSAAAGLQDMFKPPPPAEEDSTSDNEQQESTLPSSPPGYPQRIASNDLDDVAALDGIAELDDDEDNDPIYPNEVTPSPSPRKAKREIKYKLNVEEASQPSDLSQQYSSPSQRRDEVFRDDSCLSAPSENGSVIRKVSGQSVIRNEDFSPILIGRHSDQDGKVDFAPIEVPADQLKQKLENLRINQMLFDSQVDARTGFDASGQEVSATAENTEDYARHGGFLNLQRGGRSGEGSFRFRALSPGLGGDSSEMLPEESLQASTPKQFPSIRTEATNPYQNDYFSVSPSMPRAPFPSPEKRQQASGSQMPSAGSPLKLFGPYDTFTNQTLLRRISQFEDGISGTTSRQTSILATDPGRSPQIQAPMAASNSHELPEVPKQPHLPRSGSVSQFGAGDLEGYVFSGDNSYASDKENALPEPSPPNFIEPIFQRPVQPSSPDSDSELFVRRRRNTASSSSRHNRTVSSSGQLQKLVSPAMGAPEIAETPIRDGSEGKRQRTSPSKDPTPKRRRTLHRSDIAFGREDYLAAVDTVSRQMQAVMGKKRKDARPGDFELANPNVLALRSILRPRTPTPSQRSSLQREHHPFAELQQEVTDEQPRKSAVRALQDENMPPQSGLPHETDRKPSIRTQDFVDQAAQIMAMIRNQVRPRGLASVEESEAENGTPGPEDMDDSYQSSTKEPFSRPPSREGRPLPRLPARQEDPELIDRLKKYQELSDMGDVISSSMRSMGAIAKDAIRAAQEIERQIDESSRNRSDGPWVSDQEVVSDPPNIRLSTNPSHNGLPASPSRDYPSNSSANSTNRTYPTASSRGSDSRKTIMPESVSHLIPDRVGSMFLDKQNNIWIKKKESQFARSTGNILPSEDSEDDPFASIPDLSVDLTKEMNHLQLTTAQKAKTSASPGQIGSPVSPSRSPRTQAQRGYVTLSPDAQLSPNIATLAREEIEKLDARAMEGSDVDENEEVEREISIIEGRDNSPPSTARRRNLTISFSSPVASIIQDVLAEDLDSMDDDPQDLDEANSLPTPKKSPGYPCAGRSVLKNGGHGSVRSNQANARRLVSTGPAFIPRPVSRIEEQDEESTIEIPPEDQRQLSYYGETSIISHKTPDGHHTSLSFIINQSPDKQLSVHQADESALIGQNVGKLSLSPLSEFTLNNSDPSFGFEVSYVMGRRYMATGDGSKKVMSMTIRELVDKLSEVEPFEPYWEDMTELDLHEKRLGSLHMLDEFCGKLVTLDASKNALGHLDGVPASVRQLKVSHNLLTELTSWDHLMNLQYVDISGNEVKSLSALKNLVHLRSIKADNNQLTSLDGLDVHDGLLSLRARDNLIEEVDLGKIKMERLTELDLEGNSITSIRGLEQLPALSKLKLGKNGLQKFAVKTTIQTLRQLDLCDNELTCLDISNMPNLHSLHADRNRITEMTGFGRARRLDSLSLREQRGDGPLDLNFLAKAYESRKLFLSGNYLGVFEPKVDFLNLQLLELANCGLQHLPANLGQLMPNLRTLNLNFNAVADLSALQFIPRLKKLLVAGNRLADSTSVTELLTDFPHLTQVDLRDNPVTIGFYAPVQVLVSADGAGVVDPFTLPAADEGRDETFASRLDEATKLRRRLHQIVFAASCKRLRMLDGLPMQRDKVLAKDGLYQLLVDEGLLPDETLVGDEDLPKEMTSEPAVQYAMDSLRSSRWNAEDSFA